MSRRIGVTAQLWETMWASHVIRCNSSGIDPTAGAEISRLLDRLPAALQTRGIECDDVEMEAALAYFEAAAGKRRNRRPRLLAWYDKKFKTTGKCGMIRGCWRFRPPPWPDEFEAPPSLQQMLRSTVSEEVRRDAPVELMLT
jgi:hypothetical protein